MRKQPPANCWPACGLTSYAWLVAAPRETKRAWEAFLLRYREPLYDMAHSIAKEDNIARELADDIFATSTEPMPQAASAFPAAFLHGVGSLAGWLRAVMARAYYRYLSPRPPRTVVLEEEQEFVDVAAAPEDPGIQVDPRLEEATAEALSALAAEDDFYSLRIFRWEYPGGSSSHAWSSRITASRRVEKITSTLRKGIRECLRRRGMTRAEAEEALEADVRDLQIDVGKRLKKSQENPVGTVPYT